jgi:hypothetical protein
MSYNFRRKEESEPTTLPRPDRFYKATPHPPAMEKGRPPAPPPTSPPLTHPVPEEHVVASLR